MTAEYSKNEMPSTADLSSYNLTYPSAEDAIACSPFLQRLVTRYDFSREQYEKKHITHEANTILADLTQLDFCLTEKELAKLLRDARNKIAFLLGVGEVSGKINGATATYYLSCFQESALNIALAFILGKMQQRGLLQFEGATTGNPASVSAFLKDCGYTILGMGKLGGRELNYSSDIDLIVLFDGNKIKSGSHKTVSELLVRATRQLIDLFERRTEDGYVARIDLRLRPDPSSNPIAMNVLAAERYYQSQALNWERAAFIKARPIAGDIDIGYEFLEQIRPWLWRRSLDYIALEDLVSLKRRSEEHGDLDLRPSYAPNVKLSAGGIRDIEFHAQILQLLFAGKLPALRMRSTEQALLVLSGNGHISAEMAKFLINDYWFLRRVEHACQIIDDQQTHDVPEDAAARSIVAKLTGYPNAQHFDPMLKEAMQRVSAAYNALLPEQDDRKSEALGKPDLTPFKNTNAIEKRLAAWRQGKIKALSNSMSRQRLEKSLTLLMQSLGDTPEPDAAFSRFDRFISGLPSGAQLFAMFEANPKLVTLLARVMGLAPAIGDILAKRPMLLGHSLEPDFFYPLPDAKGLANLFAQEAKSCTYIEERYDHIRRFHQEMHFRAAILLMEGISPPEDTDRFLSDLADLLVRQTYKIVFEEFSKKHGSFKGVGLVVLALGRWGGNSLTFSSDLDIIYVYDITPKAQPYSDGEKPLAPSHYYSRLAQKLTSALTMTTAAGPLYEVDTRLRPSGSQGPIAVSLNTFLKYFKEDAWTWEKLALTRARSVINELSDETAILQSLKPRTNVSTLKTETCEMRQKLRAIFDTNKYWDVKHGIGGLVDLEFLTQYLLLTLQQETHPKTSSKTRPPTELGAILRYCAKHDQISEVQAEALIEAGHLMHCVLLVLRLSDHSKIPESEELSPALRDLFVRILKAENFSAFKSRLSDCRALVAKLYESNLTGAD